jgi:hypothetical protein
MKIHDASLDKKRFESGVQILRIPKSRSEYYNRAKGEEREGSSEEEREILK